MASHATRPLSVVMIIPSLGSGGAERAMSELANFLADRHWRVCIVTFQNEPTADFYPLRRAIHRVHLQCADSWPGPAGKLLSNLSRTLALRRALREQACDVALAFMETANVLAILATRGLGMRTVVAERIDPAMNTTVPAVWQLGRRALYRYADAVVAQTETAASWLRRRCGVKVKVLPNALRRLPDPSAQREPMVLSVGRMEPQKGFDVLLRAFAAVSADFPSWRLAIVGDGSLRRELQHLAAELQLLPCVEFAGRRTDIETWYGRAAIVAQASRFEGFPNAVLEAMGMGAAVISTDCRSGPRELISAGHDGLLVPVDDVSELASALRSLMGNAQQRDRLGRAAMCVRERYAANSVLGQWEQLLNDAGASGT
jgi:GalNAc-alpha-(1->4)-GalNAc-alpha-(1->3)-diNAcBac-PP-undecaprenol alpha-1,4-N-acetyl-D-galactosaminyltransferase